jgi:hypothetical protein
MKNDTIFLSQDNGGCSFFATCSFNEKSLETTCACNDGYIGDGKKCVGDIWEVNNEEKSLFYSLDSFIRLSNNHRGSSFPSSELNLALCSSSKGYILYSPHISFRVYKFIQTWRSSALA